MGGDLLIEQTIGCQPAYMGANLWLFFSSPLEAAKMEEIMSRDFLVPTGTSIIYGFAASGTKVTLSDNSPMHPLYPEFIPSLRCHPNIVTAVPAGIESIVELIIDGFSFDSLQNCLSDLISFFQKENIVKIISAGNYDDYLGILKIYLKEL